MSNVCSNPAASCVFLQAVREFHYIQRNTHIYPLAGDMKSIGAYCGSFKTTRPAICDLASACRTVLMDSKLKTSTLATTSPANAICSNSCISSAVPTDDPITRRPDAVTRSQLWKHVIDARHAEKEKRVERLTSNNYLER
jgi:hypothetical protein